MKISLKPCRTIIFLLWLALAASCSPSVPKVSKLAPAEVIVAFGDSLTFGTGATEAESYPAVLAQLIARSVVRAGVPGEVTAGGLARLQQVIDAHKPALMIVCLGGNDMLRKMDDGQTKANLRSIIKTIKAQGISVVLVGVPKPALVTSAPPLFEEIAIEFGIPYEGKIVTDIMYQRDQKSDAIHPNAKGYRRMAEAIAALLKKAGAV
ncbi:MAG: arylesterase [Betaproteobacteria bacterium]|nr:arylesterase [Betaproteobacteria bacterium]